MKRMEILFFVLSFLLVYSYAVYPLAVFAMSRFIARPWRQTAIAPSVTLVISVYNEERIIEQKILNTLALQYPKDLLQILIVSDGSNDRTNEIASTFHDAGVTLCAFAQRLGKTACLNRVVPDARGDIILFTDANSMFPADALRKLVRNFSDSGVGLATGWTKYMEAGSPEGTVGMYGRLERHTKYWESLISSCVGADGAIFAVRKSLYRSLEDHDINDFVIPLHTIGQGKRVVLDPEAVCFEEPSAGEMKEFRRQVRITNRTLGAIWRNAEILNPFVFGTFSFFMASHKLMRFLVPFFFMGTLLTSLELSRASFTYTILFLAHLLFTGLGLLGISKRWEGRLTGLCTFLVITLSAQLVGWGRWATGKSDTLWTPQR